MDQLLNKILKYIPESLFITLILIGGIVFLFYDSPLISVCDAQIKDYITHQRGRLFPQVVKVKNPTTGSLYRDNSLRRSRKQCIQSHQGMGCSRYFDLIKDGFEDFKKLDENCLMEFSKKPVMFKIIGQYIQTMTRLAWGDSPPRNKEAKKSWLTYVDLQTFCRAQSYYKTFYSHAHWNQLVRRTLNQMIINPENKFNKKTEKHLSSTLTHKEDPLSPTKKIGFEPKKIPMDPKRAFELSLLSLDCLLYK